MTVVPFLASLSMLVASASAAKPPLTYQQAVSAAELQSQDPDVRNWATEALAPLFAKEYESLLISCLKSVSETEVTSASVVVILALDGVTVLSDPESTKVFTNCIASGLRSWNWPTPPKEPIYIPLALNIHPSDPADAGKAADDVIRDVSPAKDSFERTREK